jgi:hypothetical protein
MEQLQSHIWLTASSYMGKYLCISQYINKPFLIYDFATAPLWISLYMRKIRFYFLSVYAEYSSVQSENTPKILSIFCKYWVTAEWENSTVWNIYEYFNKIIFLWTWMGKNHKQKIFLSPLITVVWYWMAHTVHYCDQICGGFLWCENDKWKQQTCCFLYVRYIKNNIPLMAT